MSFRTNKGGGRVPCMVQGLFAGLDVLLPAHRSCTSPHSGRLGCTWYVICLICRQITICQTFFSRLGLRALSTCLSVIWAWMSPIPSSISCMRGFLKYTVSTCPVDKHTNSNTGPRITHNRSSSLFKRMLRKMDQEIVLWGEHYTISCNSDQTYNLRLMLVLEA